MFGSGRRSSYGVPTLRSESVQVEQGVETVQA